MYGSEKVNILNITCYHRLKRRILNSVFVVPYAAQLLKKT